MKKRILAVVLAMVMAMSSLTGCGKAEWKDSPEVTDEDEEERIGNHENEDSVLYRLAEEAGLEDGKADFNSRISNDYGVVYSETCDEGAQMAAPEGGAVYNDVGQTSNYPMEEEIIYNTEEYSAVNENGFCQVSLSPLSTFSADVDTASYANVRRMIRDGYGLSDIPEGAVRIEECINYFSYDYANPEEGEPFSVNATISSCPWNEDASLMVLGMQSEKIDFSDAADTNVVFLIDVSGSMYDADKLPLLQESFALLVENLDENDRVSIVTYASADTVVLEGEKGSHHEEITEALYGLEAGGSTNGGAGLLTAYWLAEEYFIEGGNNRVIIASDGDMNVGVTSESDLKDLIEEERESGIYLTVLGFGTGNYSDTRMETLADYGNGNYAYIDSLTEANKVLVEELGATMVTVADDVKFQVEFNPNVVAEYRLVGYENRVLATEDFEDDTKDAGEIGAGHSVTVLYEIITVENSENADADLRYQESNLTELATESDEWLTVSVRYKEPGDDTSILLEYPIGMSAYTDSPSDDYLFAAAVAEYGMILSGSEYVGTGSLDHVAEVVSDMELKDEYREEFLELVNELR